MNLLQASIRLAGICVTFGVPFANANQTVAVTSPLATQPLSDATPAASATDATKRLDGRLFFSEQERRRMDDARKRGIISGDVGPRAEAYQSVLNGFVKRNDGVSTIWVDGVYKPVDDIKLISRIEPTSVGMDSKLILVVDAADIVVPLETSRAKVREKKRVPKRKSGSRANPPRK